MKEKVEKNLNNLNKSSSSAEKQERNFHKTKQNRDEYKLRVFFVSFFRRNVN